MPFRSHVCSAIEARLCSQGRDAVACRASLSHSMLLFGAMSCANAKRERVRQQPAAVKVVAWTIMENYLLEIVSLAISAGTRNSSGNRDGDQQMT